MKLSTCKQWSIVFASGFFIFLSIPKHACHAATYYIRADGGSSQQCNGSADAPYAGSGVNLQCAWSHPFWALDHSGQWKIQGGDTILISEGSYLMGYGAPNSGWCDQNGAFACHLPALPSGADAQNPTRILGKGWDSGCNSKPELWGTQRQDYVLDLAGTSNALIDCIEITDHSGCVEGHSNPSIACQRDVYPFGEWAVTGIYASDSANVTLRNLNIHGLAVSGIHAGRLTDWTVDSVTLSGNGSVGWDGDIYDNSSNNGTITLRRLTVQWNGCSETYPGKVPDHCWAQSAGGYGDGVGVARSGGRWIIEDSVFSYNTSDGLDLLYVGVGHPGSSVEIKGVTAIGNSGNQIKVGGSSSIVNTLAAGNCGFFYQKSFAQEMGDMHSGDICRAGGAAVALSLGQGNKAYLINSTVVSQGWAIIEAGCNTSDFPDQPPCNGTEGVTLQNNIFKGYQVIYLGYERLSDLVGDGDPSHFTTAGAVDYNVIYSAEVSSPTGANNIFQDPMFINSSLDNFNGHLKSNSPAIDNGLAPGSVNSLVPFDDISGAPRPGGAGVDRGAYETCLATLSTLDSTRYSLDIPIVSLNGSVYLWAAFDYTLSSDGFLWFKAADYGTIDNAGLFVNCGPATLSSQSGILHIPALYFNGISLWVNLAYDPSKEGIQFKVTGFGIN